MSGEIGAGPPSLRKTILGLPLAWEGWRKAPGGRVSGLLHPCLCQGVAGRVAGWLRRVVQQPTQEVDGVLPPRLCGGDVNEGGDSPVLLRRRVLPGLPGSSFIYLLTAV
jgi:hypothetical protein